MSTHRRGRLLAVTVAAVTVAPLCGTAPVTTAAELSDGCDGSGCGADDAGAVVSALTADTVAELEPSWSVRTGGRVYGSPALADGTVFVPSEDHHVYALDAASGVQRWAHRTGGPVWSTPAVAGGAVYVGSADHGVRALDAVTGELRWRTETGGDVVSSPVVADGTVHVGSNDHHVYALDAATGEVRWRFRTGDRVSSGPAIADGTVFVGSNDHHVYALDAATGEERWRFRTDAWVLAAPTVHDGTVYVTSNGTGGEAAGEAGVDDGRLYALDAATGALRWESAERTNTFSSAVVVDDVVVATSFAAGSTATGQSDGTPPGSSVVRAHDAGTGAVRWQMAATGHLLGPAAVVNGLVIVIDSHRAGDGRLLALDLATGAVRHALHYPVLDSVYGAPVVGLHRLYFGAGDGTLRTASIDPADGTRAAGRQELEAHPTPEPALPYSRRDVLGDMIDPESPARMRLPGDGVARMASSTDPRGLNDDFTHFHGVTDDGRRILADVRGPGVLTDMYMYYNVATTATGVVGPPFAQPDLGGLVAPELAMYVDGELVFEMNAAEFYGGGAGFPFVAPLTGEASASQYSHVPVPFRERLLVVAEPAVTENNFWYNLYYTEYPDSRGVESFDPERHRDRYQALIERWSVVDEPATEPPAAAVERGHAVLAPGESVDLLDVTGGGQVDEIRLLHFDESPDVVTTPSSDPSRQRDPRAAEPLRFVRIRARWDGRPEPSVDAPVGDFFGTGFGQAQDYDTLAAGMHTTADVSPQGWPHPAELSMAAEPGGVSMYSRWPMPFARRGEVWLTNEAPAGSPSVEVAYEVHHQPGHVRFDETGRLRRGREEVGYFHATEFDNYNAEDRSPQPDRDANDAFARLEGRGNYVGHVLNMRTHRFGTLGLEPGADNPIRLLFMEGDCMFWVDDAPDYRPDVTSTGHEECFDTGAYFQGDEGNPTAGTTNRDVSGLAVFGNVSDEVSVYRYWMGDAIAFQDRFEATIERGTGNSYRQTPAVEQSGVAFYYLDAPSTP